MEVNAGVVVVMSQFNSTMNCIRKKNEKHIKTYLSQNNKLFNKVQQNAFDHVKQRLMNMFVNIEPYIEIKVDKHSQAHAHTHLHFINACVCNKI